MVKRSAEIEPDVEADERHQEAAAPGRGAKRARIEIQADLDPFAISDQCDRPPQYPALFNPLYSTWRPNPLPARPFRTHSAPSSPTSPTSSARYDHSSLTGSLDLASSTSTKHSIATLSSEGSVVDLDVDFSLDFAALDLAGQSEPDESGSVDHRQRRRLLGRPSSDRRASADHAPTATPALAPITPTTVISTADPGFIVIVSSTRSCLA
ncbi:uncharacterized protein MKK02DRAFT_45419 [Dioszegia hungarica]|uniref:Uncharacterized protein n=1 Tax=Dioszegia hungarica TaxID=4972 RepID=A0AA38HCX2_9TREE|nr:uncharacterized protein MKK02DRAFT_45419 [Dioszegia hungarica]KAI9636714.1 hypothetical protein MKK02DRAFT_45419 [Dioszegia hungarica]